jgi:mandelamide amidase
VEKTTTDVLQRLKDNGIVIKPIEFPQDIVDLNKKLSMDLVFSDYFADLDGYLHSHDLDKKTTVHQLVESVESSDVSDILSFYQNNPISGERKREILEDERPRLQERLKHTMQSQEVQVIVFPTTPVPPTRIQQGETIELNGNSVPLFPTHVRNNDISANAGFPSLALCIGKTTKGLPIGINIEALPGCDQDVLAMGCTIEKYLKPPSVPQ